jgi:hypothetical protein
MKKIITLLTIGAFICGLALAEEKKTETTTSKPSTSSATPATPATPAQPEKEKPKILSISGEITEISTTESTITVKKEDGTTVKIKAKTPKAKEVIVKLKVGDKVNVTCRETKEGDKVLMLIRKQGEERKKEGKKEETPKKSEEGKKEEKK